jgi:hypothetical protein
MWMLGSFCCVLSSLIVVHLLFHDRKNLINY